MSETTAMAVQARPSILSPRNFAEALECARILSDSEMVPEQYRKGNAKSGLANTLVALEMSMRTGMGVLEVMQSLYVVKGKPSWSAQFVIALVNSSGRFSPMTWESGGEGDGRWWQAVSKRLADGVELRGARVTMAMAKGESWGAKWKTMPEQMGLYRAASFWARVYAPELLLGMHTVAEVEDIAASADARDVEVLEEWDPRPYLDKTAPVIEQMRHPETTRARMENLTAQLTKEARAMGAPGDFDARDDDERAAAAWSDLEYAERQG